MILELTEHEVSRLDSLRQWPGMAWDLWKEIGARAGIDFSDGRIALQRVGRSAFSVEKTPLRFKRRPVVQASGE
jgi:hypothetical protein